MNVPTLENSHSYTKIRAQFPILKTLKIVLQDSDVATLGHCIRLRNSINTHVIHVLKRDCLGVNPRTPCKAFN